jgi:hypothetical protein
VTTTSLANAIAALPSGGTLRIAAGTFSISSEVSLVSNLVIECSPNNQTMLQAIASFPTTSPAMILISGGASHVRIEGCVIDGNRSNNSSSNLFDLVQVDNASHVDIVKNHLQNTQGNGIRLGYNNTGSVSHVRIEDNEIDHFGQPLPSTAGIGIASIPGTGNGNGHIQVSGNLIHDGNTGMSIQPSEGSPSLDFQISHNRFYSNVGDGFQVYSTGIGPNQPTQDVRFEDNESYCNGWPASGTGFSANCTAGFLQNGNTGSSGVGVGVNFNSATLDEPMIVGNRSHDNFFEGFDVTPLTYSTVTCNGTTSVTGTGGDPFNTAWKIHFPVRINSINYLIASVSSTTSLTLTSNCPSGTGLSMSGISYTRGLVVGNAAYANGRGNNSSSGHGFSDSGAYGDTYVGNSSYLNQGLGFLDTVAAYTTHTGDKAWNNDNNGGFSAGLLCLACFAEGYYDVFTDDSSSSPKQTVGIQLDQQTSKSRISTIKDLSGNISDAGSDDTLEGYTRLNVVPTTTIGTAIATTVLLANATVNNNSYAVEFNVFQVTAGAGCSAATNTATVQYTFVDPTNTTHTNVAGPQLSFAGNGAVGTYVSSVVSLPIFATTQISWNTVSTLSSTGCTTTPQYQVSVKLVG